MPCQRMLLYISVVSASVQWIPSCSYSSCEKLFVLMGHDCSTDSTINPSVQLRTIKHQQRGLRLSSHLNRARFHAVLLQVYLSQCELPVVRFKLSCTSEITGIRAGSVSRKVLFPYPHHYWAPLGCARPFICVSLCFVDPD